MHNPAPKIVRPLALLLAIVLFNACLANAQKAAAISELRPLAPGITLPVRLGRSLEAGKVKPGTSFLATTTQRVPIAQHLYLHHGAKLHGVVVTSTQGNGTAAKPSILSIRFTSLQYKGQTVPVATKVIAIANFVQVDETALPAQGSSDRGNPSPASWTTSQIGGDIIARSGWIGDLTDSSFHKVGSADYFGVYTLPLKPADGKGPPFPRALGVFSATAAGLYGIEAGTSMQSASGTITLTRPDRKLLLRDGDHLLLEVVSAGQSTLDTSSRTR